MDNKNLSRQYVANYTDMSVNVKFCNSAVWRKKNKLP